MRKEAFPWHISHLGHSPPWVAPHDPGLCLTPSQHSCPLSQTLGFREHQLCLLGATVGSDQGRGSNNGLCVPRTADPNRLLPLLCQARDTQQALHLLRMPEEGGTPFHFSPIPPPASSLTCSLPSQLSPGISYWLETDIEVDDSLWPYGPYPTRLLCPWDSPGKNTGAGYHALLQGIFPTQGSNPSLLCLLLWQAGSLPLAPPGRGRVYPTQLDKYRSQEALNKCWVSFLLLSRW